MSVGHDPSGPRWNADQVGIVVNHTRNTLSDRAPQAITGVIRIILAMPLPTDSSELRWLRDFFHRDERRLVVEDLRKAVHVTRLIASHNITCPSVTMEAELDSVIDEMAWSIQAANN